MKLVYFLSAYLLQ